MNATACSLPQSFLQDINDHAQDVDRFRKGELSASIMKARRVPRGIYEQRRDGAYMVRVRLPGGALSAAQARALAGIGSCHGNGTLHVTTRQDIQVHGVRIDETPAIMRELFLAGLTSKGGGGNTVRNVTACPYAGICPAERFDVTPCVMAVTEYLIGLPGSYNLPRKYKIAFSGCDADCALAAVNDLGFVARFRDGEPGFVVHAGGGMGAESRVGDQMEEWVPARDVVRISAAVRRLFDQLGDRRNRRRARLRFAVERVGVEPFRAMFKEAVAQAEADGVPVCDVAVSTEGKWMPPPADHRLLLQAADGLPLLWQRQPGFVAVPIQLPLGEIGWSELEWLAGLAERFSAEKMLRATRDQDLVVPFVREGDLSALRSELSAGMGGDALERASLASFTACTGAATCRLGLCQPQPAARACAAALTRAGVDPLALQVPDIRMNGCPNACGQHPIGTIGLFGVAQRAGERLVPAYRVLLGARRGEKGTRLGETVGTVPARRLPEFMVSLLQDLGSGRQPGETLPDYFDRVGAGHFESLVEVHASVPAYEDDPGFYRDWGQDEDFTLAGRGPGECGAGVFEVISEDLSSAARALESLSASRDPGATLFDALLPTVRALLITRGVDTQDPLKIIGAFEKHFVETGLVDGGFRSLVESARSHRGGQREALADREKDIRRLLERVEYLFSTMDADLRFHVPEADRAAGVLPAPALAVALSGADGGESATLEIDLRGVACPMNFVKAKLRLELLDVGATLGVLLDDGEPVQNVPASFRSEGQEVLDIRRAGNGHWRVVIRKAKG